MRSPTRLAAVASLAALFACSDGDPPTSAPDSTPAQSEGSGGNDKAQPPPAPSKGKVVTAKGWSYDPDDLTGGFPDVTTIRLGDKIRIWSRAATDWFPMTVAMLDEHDISMVSFRLDVPPKGSITGSLPETPRPCVKVRITQCITTLENPSFERRIGVIEPELTTPRLRDLGIISKDRTKHPDPTVSPYGDKKITDLAIEDITTEFLQDQFGRDVIIDGSTVYLSGSNPWKSRPVSDAEWLDGRIQAYLRGVITQRRNPQEE